MSVFSEKTRDEFTKGDYERDKDQKIPDNVTVCKDIAYGDGGVYHLLDIVYPKGTEGKLPVIVSVHGGAYVYGTKEVYQYYAASLAQLGFAVVNFNYHLAPEYKFPVQLSEINQVLQWMACNGEQYHLNLDQVFMVGDSAGAQLASQFCAILTNPEYAEKFPFQVTKEIKIRAVALNCGMYDISSASVFAERKGEDGVASAPMMQDYVGDNWFGLDELLRVPDYITSDYPPAFIMTSWYDFLKGFAEPMYRLLLQRGVTSEYRLYGKEGQEYMGHVFHCNMNLEEAGQCNRDECAFFRSFL